ncbi:MAG: CBS domain-containing protein [Sedimentisphaerales bacterium]|jgi:CBS domain-containing protein|nr:CBS domain-containing protein [Sedimentisphaerales bacterium]HNY78324.1 CBS domain-containing protein [Sedimentisphaerales bacterium]HOC63588.1 CBS domain-containing protein [Sedimentisphaerales bacterium]HOH62791.1 CBS domain-containing protein [Sedimentisphaerales bacterium]HQA91470.1 CBS domain-containing protein [Sedimentisphaerales bacterium]
MEDATETRDFAATADPGMRSPVLLGFKDADLKVKDIMTDNVVCAVPGETVLSAVRRMAEQKVSCVIVVVDDTVVGILTERDVLRGVAAGGRDRAQPKVAERMSSPVVSTNPEAPILEASEIMQSRGIKRLAVGDGKRLLGLVTQTDITRGLTSLWPFKEIADIMSRNVVVVNASATVAQAARLMSSSNISCVVVIQRGEAVGIVTEKDVLKRVVALHRDPGTTPVADIMSCPLVTSSPDHSVMYVSRMMDRMHFHRLAVKDNGQVCGIVSQTDILDALRDELQRIREVQLRHQLQVSQLTESTSKNLSLIESLVREALGTPEKPAEPSAWARTRENAPHGSAACLSHEHRPTTAGEPILTSLQDLIWESKSNIERISAVVQGVPLIRSFDSDCRSTQTPARH